MTFLMTLVYLSVSSLFLVSCEDDENDNSSEVVLLSFGPSPTYRGEELRFIGRNLDKVTSIILPGEMEITDIEQVSVREIKIVTPQDAQEGYVKLVYPDGELSTKTLLAFHDPIEIDEVSPNPVKGGQTLTITGQYLNFVHDVIFADRDTVSSEDFLSVESGKIELVFPKVALSGIVKFVNNSYVRVELESKDVLEAILPSVDEVAIQDKKNPGDVITVEGHNLDLVESVILPTGESVDFTATTDLITFTLPEGFTDGEVKMVSFSGIEEGLVYVKLDQGDVEETAIMEETRDLGTWTGEADGGAFRLYKSSFQDVSVGAILKFYFTIDDGGWGQLQINHANWGQIAFFESGDNTIKSYELELTSDILNTILTTNDGWSDTGVIVQGQDIIVSKVTIIQ